MCDITDYDVRHCRKYRMKTSRVSRIYGSTGSRTQLRFRYFAASGRDIGILVSTHERPPGDGRSCVACQCVCARVHSVNIAPLTAIAT